jgi:hypothetical protein
MGPSLKGIQDVHITVHTGKRYVACIGARRASYPTPGLYGACARCENKENSDGKYENRKRSDKRAFIFRHPLVKIIVYDHCSILFSFNGVEHVSVHITIIEYNSWGLAENGKNRIMRLSEEFH